MKLRGDVILSELEKQGIHNVFNLSECTEYELSDFSVGKEMLTAKAFEAIASIFDKYGVWESSALRLIACGAPMEQLAMHLASVLTNPFAVLDVTMGLRMTGGNIPSDLSNTIWEIVMDQGYVPSNTFRFSKGKMYFFQDKGTEPYFSTDPPYRGQHLMANIALDGEVCFLLCTTDICSHIDSAQVFLFRCVRDLIEMAFSLWQARALRGAHGITTYYIENLLKGFSVDTRIVHYNLGELGWKLHDNFRVYTVGCTGEKGIDSIQAEIYLEQIRRLFDNVIGFWYEGAIVMIFRLIADDTKYGTESLKNKHFSHSRLTSVMAQFQLVGGYSQMFNDFMNLKYYYIQSKSAFHSKVDMPSKQAEERLCGFESIFLRHLTHVLEESTSLKSLCHPKVLDLAAHDSENDTAYVNILRCYLVHGCNLAKCARELYMHRNSLAYHIERIEMMLGFSVAEISEAVHVQLLLSTVLLSKK